MGERLHQPENIQKPQDHSDHYDYIQDGLYRSLHWYEIYQPKQHPYYDQRDQRRL